MDYVKYRPDMRVEQKWLEIEANKSLIGAVVLVPEGAELSEHAIETIRHFRFYQDAQNGIVLLSDRVVALVDSGSVGDMVEKAGEEAYTVVGNMPDFTAYDMDDDCGIVHMSNANVYAFRLFKLRAESCGSLLPALEARHECLEACERNEITAIVYCNGEDFKG